MFIRLDRVAACDRQTDGPTDRRNCCRYYSALHCKQCGRAVKAVLWAPRSDSWLAQEMEWWTVTNSTFISISQYIHAYTHPHTHTYINIYTVPKLCNEFEALKRHDRYLTDGCYKCLSSCIVGWFVKKTMSQYEYDNDIKYMITWFHQVRSEERVRRGAGRSADATCLPLIPQDGPVH